MIVFSSIIFLHIYVNVHRDKGLKILHIGDAQTSNGVAAVLADDDDDAVDPHLERIRNQTGAEESDEEVQPFL